jgi:hypothetical protein
VLRTYTYYCIRRETVFCSGRLLYSTYYCRRSKKPHIPSSFNMNLVISKCVTAVKVSNFSDHYLRNRSTLDIGVLGYIGIF